MSEQNAYETLGLTRDASFEEIQEARSRLGQQYENDSKQVQTIEAAYDAIIMDRLKMRQEGKIKVPERIRFPERTAEVPTPVALNTPMVSTGWMQKFIDTPSRSDILWPALIFLSLAILTLLTPNENSTLRPLALGLGFCVNLYFLNRKENRFGRAFLMTFVGFLMGLVIGGLLSGLVSSPVGNGGSSPVEFAQLLTFLIFWLMSSFLR
ncbi:CPP1-like family protein [Spirulina sp. 06S082]|uniref:CPP1-like family protein n=1 Tax=Spirulina sp. 06S082 TaxID=3110248 RepID=UPI002B201531|nr:CPP1-like family protein [Spirulina sp. 06S082]MEA5471582.1 CPP1-like family protein [Spirulina sp. 06S082]